MQRLLCTLIIVPWLINMVYAQTCNESTADDWTDNRYINHGDGTVTDTHVGLMWMQCSEGQNQIDSSCNGTTTTHTWKAALELADTKSFAGHTDWRLPNVRELVSLTAINCHDPAINTNIFPNTPSVLFWSSSPFDNPVGSSWTVNFYAGISSKRTFDSNDRDSSYYGVRLVRGGL